MNKNQKPLVGKRIVVTRTPEQAHEFVLELEKRGAKVLVLPTLSFAPPETWEKLDAELRRIDWFDAILFLSKNAVAYIFDRCGQLGIRCEMLPSRSRLIGAVGEVTARALEAKGLRVDYVAKNRTGEGLVRELGAKLAGKRVLLPRSDRGDARILAALKDVGADVTEVVAYRTTSAESLDPKILARIRSGEVDAIAFASPSAFQNLDDLLKPGELASLSARIHLAAIGPTTAQAIRKAGARVAIEIGDASSISAAGFAEAIAGFYRPRDAVPVSSVRPA